MDLGEINILISNYMLNVYDNRVTVLGKIKISKREITGHILSLVGRMT